VLLNPIFSFSSLFLGDVFFVAVTFLCIFALKILHPFKICSVFEF
jgi:hypothetical protein